VLPPVRKASHVANNFTQSCHYRRRTSGDTMQARILPLRGQRNCHRLIPCLSYGVPGHNNHLHVLRESLVSEYPSYSHQIVPVLISSFLRIPQHRPYTTTIGSRMESQPAMNSLPRKRSYSTFMLPPLFSNSSTPVLVSRPAFQLSTRKSSPFFHTSTGDQAPDIRLYSRLSQWRDLCDSDRNRPR
jgi:hypothetical protein